MSPVRKKRSSFFFGPKLTCGTTKKTAPLMHFHNTDTLNNYVNNCYDFIVRIRTCIRREVSKFTSLSDYCDSNALVFTGGTQMNYLSLRWARKSQNSLI